MTQKSARSYISRLAKQKLLGKLDLPLAYVTEKDRGREDIPVETIVGTHFPYPEFMGEDLYFSKEKGAKPTRYRIVNIGSRQKAVDNDFFEPKLLNARDEGRSALFKIAGTKYEAEKTLLQFRHAIHLKVLREYARRRLEKFRFSDYNALESVFQFGTEDDEVLVLLKDPPENIGNITPREFARKAVATIQLSRSKTDKRLYGFKRELDDYYAHWGHLDHGNIYIENMPINWRNYVLTPDHNHRVMLREMSKTSNLAEVTKNVVFDKSLPKPLQSALFYKMVEAGRQGPFPVDQLIFAWDPPTRRALHRLQPEVLDELVPAREIGVPLDTEETLFTIDLGSDKGRGIVRMLEQGYLSVKQPPMK